MRAMDCLQTTRTVGSAMYLNMFVVATLRLLPAHLLLTTAHHAHLLCTGYRYIRWPETEAATIESG